MMMTIKQTNDYTACDDIPSEHSTYLRVHVDDEPCFDDEPTKEDSIM